MKNKDIEKIKKQIKKVNELENKFRYQMQVLSAMLIDNIDFEFDIVETTDGLCIADGELLNFPVEDIFTYIERGIKLPIDICGI